MFVRSSISAGRRAVPKSRARARIAYCCRDAKRTARDETRANVRNGAKADICFGWKAVVSGTLVGQT